MFWDIYRMMKRLDQWEAEAEYYGFLVWIYWQNEKRRLNTLARLKARPKILPVSIFILLIKHYML